MSYGGTPRKEFSNVDSLVEYYTQNVPESKPKKEDPGAYKGMFASQNIGMDVKQPPEYIVDMSSETKDSCAEIEDMFDENLNDSYFLA
jgi:hypothetical protein